MASAAAAQIMRQADAVKETMTGSEKCVSELWVSRQKLEDLYKRLLLLDLEYALDKKVEQDLWNYAFKNQINSLQTMAKDRQNPKKSDAQGSLNLFLETASGFYLQFLQMICSTFKLDVPFRRKSVAFGMIKENTSYHKNIVTPKRSSCLYICCHCLVHLGDIARYRQQTEQAQTYYRHASNLSPNNGQPYNQLAILEASRGDKLSTVFYYVRSLAVRHPFPVAATNLEKLYTKLIKDTRSEFDSPSLTVSEIVTAFLQFQALLHMATGIDRAHNLKIRIVSALGSHIRSQTVTAAHLTGIVAIAVFGLHRSRFDTVAVPATGGTSEEGPAGLGRGRKKKNLSSEEERIMEIHSSFIAKLLEVLLVHTPKEDGKARDFLTLSAIKVLLDWVQLNQDILTAKEFQNTSIWPDLCKLLNTHQWLLNDSNKASDLQKYEDTPLPEDMDLRCFQPLEPTYSSYNYHKGVGEELSPACERDLRCQRLVAHGKRLSQSQPRLVIYQPAKSIRNQFSTQKIHQSSERQGQTPAKSSSRKNIAMQTILKKQQQRQQDQDKSPGSALLTVISEESRSSPSETSSEQSSSTQKGRQAGVLTIPHKGSSHKNLPPRLSAKAGAAATGGQMGQNLRLHNKTGPPGGGNVAQHQVNPTKQAEKVAPVVEAFPGLGHDNYPALVSSRQPQQKLEQRPPNSSVSTIDSAISQPMSELDHNHPAAWPGFGYQSSQEAQHTNKYSGPPIRPNTAPTAASAHSLRPNTAPTAPSAHSPQPEFLASLQSRQQHFQVFQQQQQQQQQKPQSYLQHHHQQQQRHPSYNQHNQQQQQKPPTYQPPQAFHQQQQQDHQHQSQQQVAPNMSGMQLNRLLPQQMNNLQNFMQRPSDDPTSQMDPSFFNKTPAPVGFIPPPGPPLVQQSKPAQARLSSVTCTAGPTSYLGGQPLQTGGHGQPSQQPQHPLHFLQQQHQRPPQQSGLLYQNIPLPGAAPDVGKGIGATEKKFPNTSQDSRLSASFQGHAAGTPKPDKQTSGPAQFFHQSPLGPSPQFRPQLRPQTQAPPPSLRSVMGDPPFLQAGGEYSLFSGGSSPAWHPGPQHNSMTMGSQLRPGGLHGETGNPAQSLWSASGPSPLERLLEQQKNWKQADG